MLRQVLGAAAHVRLQLVEASGLSDWRPLLARMQKQPHVVAAAPGLYGEVLVARGARGSGMIVKGVIPEYENQVSDLLKSVRLGSAAALNPQPPCATGDAACIQREIPPIVLGKDLAETIGATVGTTVTVISPQGELTPWGLVPKYEQFKLVGVFNSGLYSFDASWGFIRLSDAQRLYSLSDVITVIDFKVDDLYRVRDEPANVWESLKESMFPRPWLKRFPVRYKPGISASIEEAAGRGFMATNWIEQNRELFHALDLERLVTFLFIGLIGLVAALNILISLIMMVMEKTKDVAVLLSMGARRRQVRWIFVFQGVLIGVIGTVVGLIAGYGIALAGAKYHFIRLSAEVYSIDYLPFAPRFLDGLEVALAALAISFVATLYPSWAAARVFPAEALRYE
jgi:lipoprotein-releasing system permease protein